MKKIKIKNATFTGAAARSSLIDLIIPESYSGKLVLFAHGYMGFKDWGAWNLVEKYFLSLGFAFCKYNASHNGCTIDDGVNFIDLQAFGENNYSKEMEDLTCALDWISQQIQPFPELYLIGHSRAGGIAVLSHADSRINKIATWAAISDIGKRFPSGKELDKWKLEGVRIQKNSRTNQELPLNYSQFTDFVKNKEKQNIKQAIQSLSKRLLLIHGDGDTSVSISEGEELSAWSGIPLKVISGANHTFGSSHPWKEKALPIHLEQVCRVTAEFFLKSRI
jgi:hypothetical protein